MLSSGKWDGVSQGHPQSWAEPPRADRLQPRGLHPAGFGEAGKWGGEVWAPPCPAPLRAAAGQSAAVTGWKENTTRRRANSSARGRARHGPETERNQWDRQPWHHRGTAASPRCWVAAPRVPSLCTESTRGTKPPKPGGMGTRMGSGMGTGMVFCPPAPPNPPGSAPRAPPAAV